MLKIKPIDPQKKEQIKRLFELEKERIEREAKKLFYQGNLASYLTR